MLSHRYLNFILQFTTISTDIFRLKALTENVAGFPMKSDGRLSRLILFHKKNYYGIEITE
jgi:hypothetical protein